jgi:hypothetical protein
MVHTDTTPQKDRILTMTLYLNSSQSEYDSEVMIDMCEPFIHGFLSTVLSL